MPKSKGDVSKELEDNSERSKQLNQGLRASADKETKGKSGRFSGLGETSDKK